MTREDAMEDAPVLPEEVSEPREDVFVGPNECPSAHVTGQRKGFPDIFEVSVEAQPLESVILDARTSTDPDGEVVEWRFEIIDRPEGSTTVLTQVTNEPANPGRREIFLDLAGRFEVEVVAVDDEGCQSPPVRFAIVSTSLEAIHIQLVWNNPDDPDQTDLSGSDLDLHFMKMTQGRWFEPPFDTYFANRAPFWNPERPSLDIDDTSGAGPENVNMNDPIPCQWYAVGVHHSRMQFGTAFASLRIFIHGTLAIESGPVPLEETGEFWDTARIHWPSGQIVAVDNIMPATPSGQSATITEAMVDTGLCGTPQPDP